MPENKKLLNIIILFAVFATNLMSSVVFNDEIHYTTGRDVIEDGPNSFKGKTVFGTTFKSADLSSVSFDGICDYAYFETANSGIQYDANKSFLGGGDFTTSLWMKPESSHLALNPILLEMLDSDGNPAFLLSANTTKIDKSNLGVSLALLGDSKVIPVVYADNGSPLAIDEWNNIIISFSRQDQEVTIFVNGLKYKTLAFGIGSIGRVIKSVFIGMSSDGVNGFIGSIDEVKVFDNYFSEEDAYEMFVNEKKGNNYNGDKRVCLTKKCSLFATEDADPISDIFGKVVFTKKIFEYKCVYLTEERGKCITEVSDIDYSMPDYNETGAYIDTFAGGDLAEIATIASAQSMLNSIMSGWKGYCITGTEQDFSWASDPYFWGSIALSTATSYIGANSNVASDAAIAGSATSDAASEAAKEAVTEAVQQELYQKMASYAVCAAQAGLDLASMEQDKDIQCDPVDEFCDDKASSYDDQVYTLSDQAYEDMLIENPDWSENIKVQSREDGQVTFYIVYNYDDSLSDSEMQASMDDQKEKMKRIQEYSIAAFTAICLGEAALGGDSGSATTSGGGDSGVSGSDIAIGAASTVGNAICGPLCGAAVQVVGQFATSFKHVDSCGNKDDAEEKGSRHLSTYESNQMGLCHLIRSGCKQESLLGTGCQLSENFYCCYDSVLTMVLAEQVKAQLGSSWAHCTGISLNEFMHISFTSCKDRSGVDGTSLPYDATYSQRQSAFQYQDKCIDYTRYISYISNITNDSISSDDIQDLFDEN